MNERIKKLSELTLNGEMYPCGKKVEFDRNDIFLSSSERKAKQIHDYVLAQDSLITEFQTMARPCVLDQQQVEADYLHFGSAENSRQLFRDFYCKPIENLSTFEWQHATANYAELLKLGINGMIKNIEAAKMSFESDSEKIDFLEALKVVAHTLTEWAHKCSEEALNVAVNTDNPEYKENLIRLSETLKRIPENPPKTLYEAILYINILYTYEPDSLGTLDRTLYPYYKSDLEKGLETREKTEFMIPSSVINIGNLAFYCCSNLKSVTIEENVSSIGYRAFYSCSKLEKINWNAKNVDDFSSSNVVFYKAGQSGNGIEVIFGDNVETIPAYVFYSSSMSDYPKIASVKIGENVKSIGKYAFYYSRSLTNIELPNSIESIGEYAFWYCSNLKNVTMGNGVTTIGNAAFGGCSSLTEITIPENVTSIGTWAFSSCSKLEKINWNAKNVDDFSSSNAVFYNAGKSSNGIEVIFGSSVETIPAYAFYPYSYSTSYSPKIVRATLGKEVTNIGEYAFYGCSSLETVHYNGTESNWNKITIGSDNTCLTDAAFTYFAYITIYDKDGNKVIDTTQNMGDYVDVSGIIVPVGYDVVLCKDQALTESYSLDMPISENLALYYNIVKLNKSSFSGTESADVGQKGITESVTFATDKTAKDFVATIKYSDKLNLSAITEKDFSITENLSETKNDYTYLYLTCTYKNDGNMPKNTTLNPFDLVFDVSESATANEKLTIEFVNGETFLADSGNNTYDFDGLGTAEIKVNPIFVKSITINGADEIDKATQYTAVISPENATNKDIEWTVDNSEIATISADGILTPVKAGTVKIKATAKDGSGIYDEKSVNVKVYAQITSLTANVGVWNKAFTPSEREYIIYVPKNTSSIKFTAQYSGTLKSETKTFYNGRPQTISLTDTETVLTLTYSETGYTDSEYKIKIVKFEGTKTTVSDNGTKFTVIPINIKGGTVILALYNGDTFVEMQSKPYNGDDTFTTDKAYTTAKVMVWDSLESMTPICDVEIVK